MASLGHNELKIDYLGSSSFLLRKATDDKKIQQQRKNPTSTTKNIHSMITQWHMKYMT